MANAIGYNGGKIVKIKSGVDLDVGAGDLKVDEIVESTADAGVTIEGMLLKDSALGTASIVSASGNDSITIAANGGLTLAQSLVVSGDFTALGANNVVSATNVQYEDTLLELGLEGTSTGVQAPTSATAKDIGLIFHVHDGSSAGKDALFFDADNGEYYLHAGVSETNGVLSGGSAATLNAVFVGNLTGNVTGTVSDLSNQAEAVQDFAGAMFSGNTETGITATYQDTDGTIDLVVADQTLQASSSGATNLVLTMSNPGSADTITVTAAGALAVSGVNAGAVTLTATDTQLSDEEVQDKVGAMFSSNTETLITATYQDSDGTIDLVVDNDLANYSNANSAFITAASTHTLTNKTFDANGTGNVLSNIDIGNMTAAVIVLEAEGIGSNDNDTTLPTSAAVKDYVDAQDAAIASDTLTFTNKTFDADGTGNSISNLAVADFAAAAIVVQAEGIGANNNDTTLPTSAAVKSFVDAATLSEVELSGINAGADIAQGEFVGFILVSGSRVLGPVASGFTENVIGVSASNKTAGQGPVSIFKEGIVSQIDNVASPVLGGALYISFDGSGNQILSHSAPTTGAVVQAGYLIDSSNNAMKMLLKLEHIMDN